MKAMIQIELFGDLVSWKAPRLGKHGVYDIAAKEKEYIRWQIKSHYRNDLLDCAVCLDFIFYFPLPKRTSNILRNQMLNGLVVPTKKPDATNLQKLYEDCLKGIVITDDCSVVDVTTKKRYAQKSGVLIRIQTYNDRYGNYAAKESEIT